MTDQNTENIDLKNTEIETEISQLEETTEIKKEEVNNEVTKSANIEVTERANIEPIEIAFEKFPQTIEEANTEPVEMLTEVAELPNVENEIEEVIDEKEFRQAIENQDFIQEAENQEESPEVNVSELINPEILSRLSYLIKETSVETSKREIDLLFEQYKKNQKLQLDKELRELKEKHGEDVELEKPKDKNEEYLKELEADYKKKKTEILLEQEKQKQINLHKKLEIIERIKTLTESGESLNKSFTDLKILQKLWIETGPVPNSEAKDLLNNYQLQIGKFYDLVKINYELRDLDQKRNLEEKIKICEKAEELLLETDMVVAHNKFQDLYSQWKEIGAVPRDKREEIWDRFRGIGNNIRANYNHHFENVREERNNNYAKKIEICEKIETIVETVNPQSNKEWIEIGEKIIELQKEWKTIGTVPSAVNTEIYERFRGACNKFFEAKNEFFNNINEELNTNMQKKIELCVSAEAIQNSTEWKKTTELFLDLQKKWKEIGATPKKYSETLWKRFRDACDNFFNAKNEFYHNIEQEQTENLNKKEALIKEILEYPTSENQSENVEKLKEFQTRWTEIGYVGGSHKERLYNEYRNALSTVFKNFNLSQPRPNIDANNVKEKIFTPQREKTQNNNVNSFEQERKKVLQNIRNIELEINKLENTMSFFSNGSSDILKDFVTKIDKLKDEISVLKEQKKAIDLAERDEIKSKENEIS